MKYYAGIDIGTTGTKTVLFDKNGNAVASAYREYPLYQPQNGYVEQDPADWWNAVCNTLTEVTSHIFAKDIAGVGISGQMHGLVMLDDNGNVLRKSIIWCDQRTQNECEEIEHTVGKDKLISITASPALTGFTASKILWVKNNEPQLFSKCAHILLPKDYIRYMLCNTFATDVSDAGGMQLFDIKNRRFSEELCHLLGIDTAMLGKVYESHEITGFITEKAAKLTGLMPGTPVVGGAGDNAAAAIGTGTVCDGECFATIGTSGVVFCHTKGYNVDPSGRAHSFCAAVKNEWHMMGVTQAAGLSLKWFRDNCCGDADNLAKERGLSAYQYLDSIAKESGIGANKLLFLPYLMGERTPHLDPNARGVFFGLSAIHKKGDMVRAILEGVGFSLRDALEVLKENGVSINRITVCGGGAKSNLWCSILADIFGMDVCTLSITEGPALGAAILAMVGTGEYKDVQTAAKNIIRPRQVYRHSPQNAEKYDQLYQLYKSLYQKLKTAFNVLSDI